MMKLSGYINFRILKFIIVFILAIAFTLPQKHKIYIFLAGDSTLKPHNVGKKPQIGWQRELCQFFDSRSRIHIIYKVGSRQSIKIFINEGLWEPMIDSVPIGDWAFIVFGHNEHSHKQERYISPDSYKIVL